MLSWADDIISEADEATADFKVTVAIDSPEIERIAESGKLTFTLDRTHIKRAGLKIKTRQLLMERLNAEEFGLRQFLDVTQNWDSVNDEELITGLRAAANKAGITIEDLAAWMTEPKQ